MMRDSYSLKMLRTVYGVAYLLPVEAEHPRLPGVKDPCCILESLFISRQCRGRHYGSMLLERVCRAADSEGVTLLLIVSPEMDSPLQERALIAFYERHGFVQNRVIDGMVRKPHVDLPAVPV